MSASSVSSASSHQGELLVNVNGEERWVSPSLLTSLIQGEHATVYETLGDVRAFFVRCKVPVEGSYYLFRELGAKLRLLLGYGAMRAGYPCNINLVDFVILENKFSKKYDKNTEEAIVRFNVAVTLEKQMEIIEIFTKFFPSFKDYVETSTEEYQSGTIQYLPDVDFGEGDEKEWRDELDIFCGVRESYQSHRLMWKRQVNQGLGTYSYLTQTHPFMWSDNFYTLGEDIQLSTHRYLVPKLRSKALPFSLVFSVPDNDDDDSANSRTKRLCQFTEEVEEITACLFLFLCNKPRKNLDFLRLYLDDFGHTVCFGDIDETIGSGHELTVKFDVLIPIEEVRIAVAQLQKNGLMRCKFELFAREITEDEELDAEYYTEITNMFEEEQEYDESYDESA